MLQPISIVIIGFLLVALSIVGVAYYFRKSNKNRNGKYGKEVTIGFIIVAAATAFFIPTLSLLTVESENVTSVNNFVNWRNGTLGVTIEYTNPIQIPVRYTIVNHSTNLYVNITGIGDHTINHVQLISPANAIISFNGDLNPLNRTLNTISYIAKLSALHADQISNKTYDYGIRINYFDKANNTTNDALIPFKWTLVARDLNWLGYFWIVLAGIVASRFITFIVNTPELERLDISRTEAVWLIYSFIIAVLAFSGFKDQNILGSSIFFNIMAAFAFGFGSQKVLELAREFPRSQSESLPPAQIADLVVNVVQGQINLNWTESEEIDLHHYNIYRGDEANFDVTLGNPYSKAQTNSFSDQNVQAPNTYYYRVAAVNTNNKIGKLSRESSATAQ